MAFRPFWVRRGEGSGEPADPRLEQLLSSLPRVGAPGIPLATVLARYHHVLRRRHLALASGVAALLLTATLFWVTRRVDPPVYLELRVMDLPSADGSGMALPASIPSELALP